MTADELCDRMSHAELIEWIAYDSLAADDRAKAERMSGKGMRPR